MDPTSKAVRRDVGFAVRICNNGHEILEYDCLTGLEQSLSEYPTPAELWQRYRSGNGITDDQVAERLLEPANHAVGFGERYYQQIAINRAIEAILAGQRRLLVTMATGTGKTSVAFQVCWRLWRSRWNRTGEHRRPKILYLADRNILIDQPKDGIFAAFGDARYKIEVHRLCRVAKCTLRSTKRWPMTTVAKVSQGTIARLLRPHNRR